MNTCLLSALFVSTCLMAVGVAQASFAAGEYSVDTSVSGTAGWTGGIRATGMSQTMQNNLAMFGRERALKMFVDWTKRIAAGELHRRRPRASSVMSSSAQSA